MHPTFFLNIFLVDIIRGSSMVMVAENLTGAPEANTNPQGRGK